MTKINIKSLYDLGAGRGKSIFVHMYGEEAEVDAVAFLKDLLAAESYHFATELGVKLPEFAAVRARWLLWMLEYPTVGILKRFDRGGEEWALIDRAAAFVRSMEAGAFAPSCQYLKLAAPALELDAGARTGAGASALEHFVRSKCGTAEGIATMFAAALTNEFWAETAVWCLYGGRDLDYHYKVEQAALAELIRLLERSNPVQYLDAEPKK